MSYKGIQLAAKAAVGLGTLAWNYYKRTGDPMPVRTVRPMRRNAVVRKSFRRKPYRARYVPRNLRNAVVPMRRTTAATSYALVSSGAVSGYIDIKLNDVQYSDLLGSYELFRIKKVSVEITPRYDPGQSTSDKNITPHIYCACDCQGTTTVLSTVGTVTQFGNHWYSSVPSGQKYRYTFYPKVTNVIDNAGVSTAVGSYGPNPWLFLNSNGAGITHHRLLWYIQTTDTSSAQFDFVWTIYFDVKGAK